MMLPVTVGNIFGTPVVEQLSVPSLFFYVFNTLKFHPFKADFIFGNSHKSFGARSGEQGGCSIPVTDLGQSSGLSLSTASRNRFSIST
jgi:hypothetical protein